MFCWVHPSDTFLEYSCVLRTCVKYFFILVTHLSLSLGQLQIVLIVHVAYYVVCFLFRLLCPEVQSRLRVSSSPASLIRTHASSLSPKSCTEQQVSDQRRVKTLSFMFRLCPIFIIINKYYINCSVPTLVRFTH